MKLKIKETGEIKELLFIDGMTGQPMENDVVETCSNDLFGSLDYDSELGIYECTQKVYEGAKYLVSAAEQAAYDEVMEYNQEVRELKKEWQSMHEGQQNEK